MDVDNIDEMDKENVVSEWEDEANIYDGEVDIGREEMEEFSSDVSTIEPSMTSVPPPSSTSLDRRLPDVRRPPPVPSWNTGSSASAASKNEEQESTNMPDGHRDSISCNEIDIPDGEDKQGDKEQVHYSTRMKIKFD